MFNTYNLTATPSKEPCFGSYGNLRRTATTAELPETTKLVVISEKIVTLQNNWGNYPQ